jgi:C4-dicarboxylate-specific signal transduction histidine kinase/ActR/RegA family two-component response regulator
MGNMIISIILDMSVLVMLGILFRLFMQHHAMIKQFGFQTLMRFAQFGISLLILIYALDILLQFNLPLAAPFAHRLIGDIDNINRVQTIIGTGIISMALLMLLYRLSSGIETSIQDLENSKKRLEFELNKRDQLEKMVHDRHMLEAEDLHYQLSVQHEFINAFFDSAPAGLAIMDSHCRLLNANNTFLQATSVAAQDLHGQFIRDTLPQISEHMCESLLYPENPDKVYSTEILVQQQNKATRRTVLTCFPISVEPENKKPGWGLILFDVEERRQLEERLRQSQKLEAIGRLAGGVAHDFNNLLMVIQFASDRLLRLVGADEKAHVELRDIIKATESAGALTRQLLAFSRMQVLEPRTVNLQRALNEIKLLLERSLGSNIKVKIDIKDPFLVRVDPVQLDLIVLNLAINARDAMPGGGQLIIRCVARVLQPDDILENESINPGEYAVLTVTDTGTGMDAQTLDLIFEPFFTTKGRHEGTGLGLATVHGIVVQSGGTIRVQSTPGSGSTFEIFFPLIPNKIEEEEATQEHLAQHIQQNRTILLVEDEPKVLNLMSLALKDAGHRVLTAATSKKALEIAYETKGNFDMLLTDVVLPGISGLDLANRVAGEYPNIPVLMVSGYTADNAEIREIADSPYYFMQKPFQPIELVNKVNSILNEAAAQTE